MGPQSEVRTLPCAGLALPKLRRKNTRQCGLPERLNQVILVLSPLPGGWVSRCLPRLLEGPSQRLSPLHLQLHLTLLPWLGWKAP